MLKYTKGVYMSSFLFNNLKQMKVFNDKHIAIYYLSNLHPLRDRFDFKEDDVIKQLIETKFISASEIDEDVAEYFKTKLKDKPRIKKLAKDNFIHKENDHTFSL